MSMHDELLTRAQNKRRVEPFTMTFHSYDMEVVEMLMILHCQQQYPQRNLRELSKLLNIGKSTLYRKFDRLRTEEFQKKLVLHGYSLKVIKQSIEIQVLNLTPLQDADQDHKLPGEGDTPTPT